MTALENGKQDAKTSAKKRSGLTKVAIGCSIVTAVIVLVVAAAVVILVVHRARAEERKHKQHEAETAEMFSPVMEKIEKAVSRPRNAPAGPYDIDATIRVMHELDLWMKKDVDLQDYLKYVGTHDYQHVAPDLLKARAEILRLWMEIYSSQVEAEDQRAAWLFLKKLGLGAMQCAELNPALPVSINKESVQERLNAVEKEFADRRALRKEIKRKKERLLEASFKYAETYYKYIVEWDRLCLLRDRAYLACHNQDWKAAVKSADEAITLAPLEREAHILKAMALIETGEDKALDEASGILNDYVGSHPGESAPALLLMGVLATKLKDQEKAKLRFQEASKQYPLQAKLLSDMLNAYKWRTFLRQSSQGLYILKLYRSTMLGAGYFSSDLHTARVHFAAGRRSEGRQDVLDHFSRRRRQAREEGDSLWHLFLEDMAFCEDFLGADFREILPEAFYLDLEPKGSFIGDNLNLKLTNRSDRTFHNVSLVLCVRYTDMVRGDYYPMSPKTLVKLEEHETAALESLPVAKELWPGPKGKRGKRDVILEKCRAILVADQAVAWVDTRALKDARLNSSDEDAPSTMKGDDVGTGLSGEFVTIWPDFVQDILKDILVTPGSGIGKDDIAIQLPGNLVIAKPVFRMSHDSMAKAAPPSENILRDKTIRLTFNSVADFDRKEQISPVYLSIHTCWGTVRLQLQRGDDGKFFSTLVQKN